MFIKLKVHPDSKANKLVKKGPDSFELWVKAPAERGLSRRAVAARLGVGPATVLRLERRALVKLAAALAARAARPDAEAFELYCERFMRLRPFDTLPDDPPK